ncbi:hypothetical protein EON65_14205 [archaeon]|nr:MAG: hypothetical protein EON65_14205 [archaeon]
MAQLICGPGSNARNVSSFRGFWQLRLAGILLVQSTSKSKQLYLLVKMSESKSVADSHNEKIVEIRKLLKQRDDARKEGNYARSDTLRQTLIKTYNIKIVDQPNGPSGFRFLDGTSSKLMQTDTKQAETNVGSGNKRSREEAVAPTAPPDERRNDGEGDRLLPLVLLVLI